MTSTDSTTAVVDLLTYADQQLTRGDLSRLHVFSVQLTGEERAEVDRAYAVASEAVADTGDYAGLHQLQLDPYVYQTALAVLARDHVPAEVFQALTYAWHAAGLPDLH